jgi:hypothetical protein
MPASDLAVVWALNRGLSQEDAETWVREQREQLKEAKVQNPERVLSVKVRTIRPKPTIWDMLKEPDHAD